MSRLSQLIAEEADLRVDSELNGTDTLRTWTVTVRFRGFNGVARKRGELSPVALATMCQAAIDACVAAINSSHQQTKALLQGDQDA